MAALCALVTVSCKNDDGGPTPVGGGGDDPAVTATYEVTFSPNFTKTAFPTDYPSNATFSPIVVAVHAPGKTIYGVGQLASDGLRELAETGDRTAFVTELLEQGNQDGSDFLVTTATNGGNGSQPQTVTVTINPGQNSISLVSSLSPSPDWFVGVSGVSMIASENTLVDALTVSLTALDAGTDNGTTYNAPDSPTNPPQAVSEIGEPPLGSTTVGQSVGSVTFTRVN